MWRIPFLEVNTLYLDDFLYMTEQLGAEDARQQRPIAQLTSMVLAISGNKGYGTNDLLTGYAVQSKKPSAMPAHLYRSLEIGLKLKKVSDTAFVTLRQLRE